MESELSEAEDDDGAGSSLSKRNGYMSGSEASGVSSASEDDLQSAQREVPVSSLTCPTPRGGKLEQDKIASMLRGLRLRELPDASEMLRLTAQVTRHLKRKCSTLMKIKRPKGRLIIVGDLHGHFNDLLHLLDTYGEPSSENHYLFNGDFVDRGVW